MIRTVALLGLVASASALFGFGNEPWKAGLSHKLGSFFDLPRNSTAAQEKGWTEVARPTSSESSGFDALVLWVDQNKPTVGILVDECGQTSGLQISISSVGLTSYYDMEEQGFGKWSFNNADGETEELWTKCIYFVSEDEETRKASCNETLLLRADDMVVEGINGALLKIATVLDNIQSVWVKEACVPLMGLHYYYNMTTSLGCDEPLFSWFPLYDANTKQMIGIGFMMFGSTTSENYENPSETAVKFIVPTAPECMLELVRNHGAITLHIYFINEPMKITCL